MDETKKSVQNWSLNERTKFQIKILNDLHIYLTNPVKKKNFKNPQQTNEHLPPSFSVCAYINALHTGAKTVLNMLWQNSPCAIVQPQKRPTFCLITFFTGLVTVTIRGENLLSEKSTLISATQHVSFLFLKKKTFFKRHGGTITSWYKEWWNSTRWAIDTDLWKPQWWKCPICKHSMKKPKCIRSYIPYDCLILCPGYFLYFCWGHIKVFTLHCTLCCNYFCIVFISIY